MMGLVIVTNFIIDLFLSSFNNSLQAYNIYTDFFSLVYTSQNSRELKYH